jgi:hypothetical protein
MREMLKIMALDTYYLRSEVSNSTLSEVKKLLYPDFVFIDPTNAYRFGNLLDAMITEKEKLNHFKLTVSDYKEPFTKELWNKAKLMTNNAHSDVVTESLLKMSEFQKIFVKEVFFDYNGFKFSLMMRCKFDMWMPDLGWGADIKSTAAKSHKQFVDACYHFDYDRSRVLYMMLSGAKKDMIIGISKEKPHEVFKIPIIENDDFYNSGMQKLVELAFKYHCLFSNVKKEWLCL